VIPIQVLSRYDVSLRSQLGDRMYSHCISIVDPGEDMDRESLAGFQRVLRLHFFDIEDETKATEMERRHPPRALHIRKAMRFYNRFQDEADGFTVHCHAAVHRSTAIALVLIYLQLRDEHKAMEELVRFHPLPLPNRRMMRIADQILGSDLSAAADQLWIRAERFLRDEISIDRDKYLEDLPSVE
jgi:predicted protein tyrosine phosphatase